MKCKKIIAACVLATLGIALMTASKSSLLYLWQLKHTTPLNQWYATLCLVLVVPEVASVLRTLWGSTLLVSGTLLHWPSIHVTLLGIFTAILESAAMTFFTLQVASALPAYSVLPLMHVLLLLQILIDQWKPSKKRSQSLVDPSKQGDGSVERRILNSVASAFGLVVFVVLAALLVVLEVADAAEAVSLVASFLALSVVWCQPVRQHMLCADTSSLATRQNVTLLLGVVKVGSLIGFSILTSTMGDDSEDLSQAPQFLWSGLKEMGGNPYLMWGLVLHSATNIASCMLTRLGAYYTATRSSMVTPTVLSTLIASALFIAQCTELGDVGLSLPHCSVSNSHVAVLVVALFLWAIPFITLRRTYFEPSDVIFRPEVENFYTTSYHSVCFDQNLYLNYNPYSVMFGECLHVGATQSRVFICTTMYREADYEMEQLLKSLSKVSKSQKLKKANVYMESHIFLDNGADGFTLKEFSLQLMGLVEICFSVARAESVIHKTPCGIQITCVLPGGMPLYLHLKDPSLVKAKKRWSQVMYFKYILDHRIKVTSRQRPTVHTADSIRLHVNGKECTGELEEKNGEMLVQIRTLLKGLKNERSDKTTLNTPDRDSCKDVSEQSSDQGIDVEDGISTISDSSSHKDQTKAQDDQPSDNKGSRTNDNNRSSPNATMKQSSSYGSLLSAHLLQHSKLNPAYVPDDDEEKPPKWLPAFRSRPSALSLTASEVNADGPSEPVVFSITDGLAEDDTDYTSLQLDEPEEPPSYDKNTYILATDADMLFDDTAVLDVVNVCNGDLRLGAACGRTHPMGKKINPIVWYQIFEYAKDFWMIKSAQNVIGSVMCCPGCFSLYRAEAIDQVVKHYSEPTTRAGDVFTKDTGEDRWMCTLMMMRGWKLRYSTNAVNSTYCPDNVEEFIKQRRRWILSDFANSFLVFRNLPRLMRSNGCFSFIYSLYLMQLFIIVIFSPGTTVVMLTVGVELLTGAPYHITTPVMSMVFVVYGLLCCVLSPSMQIRITKISIVVLGLSMSAVVIAAGVYVLIDMFKSIDDGGLSLVEHYLLIALTGSLLYAALIHPKECYILIYGIIYLFYFPAMYMLLPLYALCNIVDQSWGTRDNQKAKVPKLVCFPRIRRKKKKKGNKTPSPGSCENLAEDPDAVSEQIKALSEEEERFWRRMAARVIGKDINLGLNKEDLANGLRKLRNKVVVVVMIFNLLWVVALSFFYLWSFGSGESGSQISAYGIFSGVLYAFSFFIQIVGMTVYRLQDGAHRLGKLIYGTEKPHYVRCVDER
ncbi:hypothetical protein V1264_013661 [Littorina saxatilis]